jgi:hypothetical protein
MSIKKDEAYFRQNINKIFTLPNSDTKYALVDVKKSGKIFYYIYIGFENTSSDEQQILTKGLSARGRGT